MISYSRTFNHVLCNQPLQMFEGNLYTAYRFQINDTISPETTKRAIPIIITVAQIVPENIQISQYPSVGQIR